jgi:hypothetical protein
VSARAAYWGAELAYLARRLRRRPWLSTALVAAIGLGVALAVLGRPHGKSATLDGWQSVELVGVPGEGAGSCASAYPPWHAQLGAGHDQWIVCARAGGYRCYRQLIGATSLASQPIRPSPFGSNCRAALAVLRKAGILR